MTVYHGKWIELNELKRPIEVGDLVMVETFEDTLVVEVAEIDKGELWHHNGWIIPKAQIVAIKE